MKTAEPLYWEDYAVGQRYLLGQTSFTETEIVAFAREFDPQSFHIDSGAAATSMYGGLIASGWHINAKLMRLFVDNYLDTRTSLGSPGVDKVRWLRPVRAGDTLTAWIECTAKTPSRSKPDRGVLHEKWLAENQRGELVVTIEGMGMVRRRPAAGAV